MEEKKKLGENQIWSMIMMIIPIVILMNAGDEVTDESGMRILYSGIFGGIGGIIGFTANFLTKDKGRVVKLLTTIAIIIISGLIIYFLSSKPSDTEILNQEWTTQKIGKIEFDSPTKLQLQTSNIPEEVKLFYSELKIYTDKNNERTTSFLQSKILNDTILIEDAYSNALEGMLYKMGVKLEELELEVFDTNETEISSMFSFRLNGEKVNGYGYMYLNGKTLESIWLMPLKRGFSKEYIEEFEIGIIRE